MGTKARAATPLHREPDHGDAAASPLESLLALAGKSASGLTAGRVLAVDGAELQVLDDAGLPVRARRAAACLPDPEAGDVVLVWRGGPGTYVLSVLDKARPDSVLSFPGQVRLAGAGKTSLTGREVELSAVTGTFRFADLAVAASTLRMKLDKAVCLARSVESAVESVVARVRHSFRHVLGIETVRAGGLRQFISGRFYQRSQNADILAEERVRVDGDKIDLG